jgi:hypothetical protein
MAAMLPTDPVDLLRSIRDFLNAGDEAAALVAAKEFFCIESAPPTPGIIDTASQPIKRRRPRVNAPRVPPASAMADEYRWPPKELGKVWGKGWGEQKIRRHFRTVKG